MKDKAIGFLLGNMYQKTPEDLTLEDGRENVSQLSKKRRITASQQQTLELGKLVSQSMENGFSLVAEAMKTVNTVRDDSSTGLARASDMLGTALDLITKTQKQILDLENRIDEGDVDGNGTDGEGTNQRHLQTLRVTLNKAFKILDNVDV